MRILFQGDSITDGKRYRDASQRWDKNHQMGHSYAYVINALLGSERPEAGLEFVNRGVSGDRIANIYARIKEDIIDIKPDVLSILVGTNDYMTKPDSFEAIYRILLDDVREALPDVHIAILEPFRLSKEDNPDWRHVRELGERTRRVAEYANAVFIPLQKKFDELALIRESEYWVWDGVHPTENGHGVIAREWINAVRL